MQWNRNTQTSNKRIRRESINNDSELKIIFILLLFLLLHLIVIILVYGTRVQQ